MGRRYGGYRNDWEYNSQGNYAEMVQLAHGGEDSLESAIALCQNRHREAHFGVVS